MLMTPRCYERRCKHFQGVRQENEQEVGEVVICAAFPDGIPDTIAYGADLHVTPRSGQGNDIVYEQGTQAEMDASIEAAHQGG
jgi:hypothetical protein